MTLDWNGNNENKFKRLHWTNLKEKYFKLKTSKNDNKQ